MIVSYPQLRNKGDKTDAVIETIDIFPTLCELAGIKAPQYAHGQSLTEILNDPSVDGHPVVAYQQGSATIRTTTHRLILHDDGYTELYDHTSEHAESKNIALQYPVIVEELKRTLIAKMN